MKIHLLHIPRYCGQLLIKIYQHTISPDHGPLSRFFKYQVCRYDVTCSEYGYQAVGKYGLIHGSWLALKRIMRCTPWHPGGHDPLV